MKLITPGRIYGGVAALALLAVFVLQDQMELPNDICGVLSFSQNGCIVGVQIVYRGAIVYRLVAGYFISRIVDRKPAARTWTALVTAAGAACLFAMPLWIGLSLYYH